MSFLDFALEIAEGHGIDGQLGREALEGDLFVEMLVVREPHDAARASAEFADECVAAVAGEVAFVVKLGRAIGGGLTLDGEKEIAHLHRLIF